MHAADIDIGRAEQGIEVIHQQQLGVHVDVLVARLQRRRPEGGLGFGGQARWRRAAGGGVAGGQGGDDHLEAGCFGELIGLVVLAGVLRQSGNLLRAEIAEALLDFRRHAFLFERLDLALQPFDVVFLAAPDIGIGM